MRIADRKQRPLHPDRQVQSAAAAKAAPPISGLRGIRTFCPVGHSLQTKTFEACAEAEQWARAIKVEMDKGVFVSRAEAASTTLKELLERYLEEVTPLKKGAEPEINRLRLITRHPLACRFVAGVCGVELARGQAFEIKIGLELAVVLL